MRRRAAARARAAFAALLWLGCATDPPVPTEPSGSDPFGVPACPHPVRPTHQDLLEALRTGRLAELSEAAHAHQFAFETSILCESEQEDAIDAIAGHDEPWVRGALDRYVEQAPRDYAAHSLRGHYWVKQGFRRRGTRPASETSEERFGRMRAAFARAERDLERAIALAPAHVPAYTAAIDALETAGRSDEALAIFQQGIEVRPLSYRLRRARIHYLEPRWGGSYREMEAFAREAQRHAPESPKLRRLLGFADADRGSVARRQDRHAEAIETFDRALRYHRPKKWLELRAHSYLEVGDAEAAIRDYDEILDRFGEDVETLRRRGLQHARLGRYEAGLRDLDRAVSLAPADYHSRANRAWVSLTLERDEAAVPDLRAALETEPDNVWALRQLGLALTRRLHRVSEAVPVYRKLVELEPEEPTYWRFLGDVLFDLHDPEHVDALRRYLELVDPEDPVEREYARKVRTYLDEGIVSEP